MSRQQDLMFCKIAVANGMVSEDHARKCLAIVNKREQESGRRPHIGAVFSKYNILQRQQVQMVYEAVDKRMGGGVPSARALPTASRGGRREPRAKRGFAGRDEQPTKRRVDPTTLWVGVAFGVIFLGVVIALVVMFVTGGSNTGPAGEDASATASAGESGSGESSSASASMSKGAAGAIGDGTDAATAAARPKEMDPTSRGKISQWMNDARFEAQIDPAKALKMIDDLKNEIATKQIFITPDLQSEIDTLHADLVKSSSGESDGEPDGTGDAADSGDDDI